MELAYNILKKLELAMASLKETLARFKHNPTDLLCLDASSAGVAAVRMKKEGESASLVGAELLPAVTLDPAEDAAPPEPPEIPPKLKARYAAVAIPGEDAIIKRLSFPGQFDAAAAGKLIQNLGLDDPDEWRISYKLLAEGRGKTESVVLAVAVPESSAVLGPMLLPSGLPVPFALEVSGLAALTAFLHGPGGDHMEDSVAAMDFGDSTSSFAIFNNGLLALIRRFDVGTDTILEKIQESLGVDRDTAKGIVADGAFDISQPVSEVLEPLIKQIMVSRDFVERREDCHISKIYVSGGLVISRDSLDEMRSSVGIDIDPWSPFDKLTVQPDAVPENLVGQEWRFSAAVGTGLGVFEEG